MTEATAVPASERTGGSTYTAVLLRPSGAIQARLSMEAPAPRTLEYDGWTWRRSHRTTTGFAFQRER